MADDVLPDPSTRFGERVRRRLRDEPVIWLTTVGSDGTPQPNPVWFWWDGVSLLTYNRPDAKRLAHLRPRPRVSLNLDGNGNGGDIVVLTGTAEIAKEEPPADEKAEYLAKYRDRMTRESGSPHAFAASYPVAVRIRPLRVRGF